MRNQDKITENSYGNFQNSVELLKKKERDGVLLLKSAENVFDRIEIESPGTRISLNTYNFVIGIVLSWGFLLNWMIVKFIDFSVITSINKLVFIIGYFIFCIIGILLFKTSKRTITRFIGYNFVVIPIGLVINSIVYKYDSSLVINAIRVTGLVTVTMMCFGTLFPKFFQKITGTLTITLLALVVIEAIELLILNKYHDTIVWPVVLIFCCYVGIDWARANRIPKTFDNAVESAAALYMDIINLFLFMFRVNRRRQYN